MRGRPLGESEELAPRFAQVAKLDRDARLLELEGGECVLEIGCGWGALAERLIRRLGCTVTGITLSTKQLAYAGARLADKSETYQAPRG